MSLADTDAPKYRRLDLDKFVQQQDAGRQNIPVTNDVAAPVSRSWTRWHVTLPTTLALMIMFLIGIFEILVAASMGVRVLRFTMVSWLAYALGGTIVVLLSVLVGFVAYQRMGALREFFSGRRPTLTSLVK